MGDVTELHPNRERAPASDHPGEVVEFPGMRVRVAFMTGPAVCLGCRHEWTAVAPEGTVSFECPECHTFRGVRKGIVYMDEPHWRCKCGNDLLRIVDGLAYCVLCGCDWPCLIGADARKD